MQQDLNNVSVVQDEELDIRSIIFKYLSYWRWFIVSIVFFTIVGFVYLKRQNNIYENNVIVLLKDENTATEEMLLLQDLGMSAGKNNIENEIALFKSPDLITKAVTSLELYTTYRKVTRWSFNDNELYGNAPLYIRWEDMEPKKIPAPVTFTFTPQGKGFEVSGQYENMPFHGRIDTLPVYLKLPMGRFYVSRNNEIDPAYKQEPYTFEATISNPSALARRLSAELKVTPSAKQSSVLTLSIQSEIKKKGRDFLQQLVNFYNEDATNDKNMVAHNTAVFIEERIKEISVELGTVEKQVEDFRQQKQITDIQAEAQLYLGQTGQNEQKRVEIETQLNLTRFVEDFIARPANANKLIPNLGVTDAGLVSVINEYNQLLLMKERLESSSSESNPALIQMKQQVSGMRQSIQASLSNVRHASEIALRDLNRQNTVTNARIQDIPAVEREYKDILRQQEVKNNLFVFLLQKREETALTQAAVAPKAKIVSEPYSSDVPVAPKRAVILLAFFLVGCVLPVGAIFVRDLFHTSIESMDDLAPLKDIDVIGDIQAITTPMETALVVQANDDSPVTELFRTLRNNLLFMLNEPNKKVVMVTSTVPGEGKTFISINLARSLSLMDKKVLLIGGDIRNPKLSHDLGIPKVNIGFSTYLAGMAHGVDEVTEVLYPNFHIMQAGPVPPNPNELLSKQTLNDLFDGLREVYDYIIIDSAPVGVVSDSFMLNRVADVTLYVMRERVTQKDAVNFVNSIKRDNRLTGVTVVLNATTPQGKYGSYKYGYKYSYRYGYSQTYGYGKSKKA